VGAPEGHRQHGCTASLGSALEMPWLALGWPLLSSYMCEQIEKADFSPCTAPISGGKAFFPVWAS